MDEHRDSINTSDVNFSADSGCITCISKGYCHVFVTATNSRRSLRLESRTDVFLVGELRKLSRLHVMQRRRVRLQKLQPWNHAASFVSLAF